MSWRSLALAVVVLGAGAGSRFGGASGSKLIADLDGRPVLAHVLDAVRDFAPIVTVVVLGAAASQVEAAIAWVDEIRVRNPSPERGLASSLKVAIDALEAMDQPFDGAFIALGDQPRLRADVMRMMERSAAGARPADRPFVVPRYAGERGPKNPVLLLRPAWSLVAALDGDAGLGALIEARPDRVLEIPVEGVMPDVDTPADLERLRAR